jgi:dTDP-L-rhamnose 4-epimerase
LDCFAPEVHGQRYQTFKADWNVGNPLAIQQALYNVDAVIHLAAKVSVADSAENPAKYLADNSLATATLCEALRERLVKRLVVASSMSVYGEGLYVNDRPAPTPEHHRVMPESVYGLTKYDQERLCLLTGKSTGISTAALRLFNVYGPGQASGNRLTGVLANWLDDLWHGRPPRVCEDGQQTRDFVFVEDVARAFCLAVESSECGVFNIGTGVATSLLSAAQQLASVMDRPELSPVITGETRQGDVRHCYADIGLAKERLQWSPRTALSEGLAKYVQWERSQR